MPEPDKQAVIPPPIFRAQVLEPVMSTLRAGECCSIVGAGGVGKSNLARMLASADVQQHYWGAEPAWIVLIDSNAITSALHDGFGLLELVIHCLIREAERRCLDAEFVAGLDQLHSRLVGQPNALLALRYTERIIGRLLEQQGLRRIVLLFDQFEDIWANLDAQLFLNLRYLRDEFKYRLVYLTVMRERLQRVRRRSRDDVAAVEAFWELFEPHVFGLGMCNWDDAMLVIERIARRHDRRVAKELAEAAFTATGGHPALLRATYWTVQSVELLHNAVDEIIAIPEIAQECVKLWQDLLPDEQHLIRMIATDNPASSKDNETLAELRLKGLVTGDPPRLFAPIFSAFVQRQSGLTADGVVVDRRLRLVWKNGRQLEGQLTPLEFSLLEYLASRAGEVCSRDEILAVLYPDDHLDANDDRIDTLVRRLREALGEDGRRPHYILTVRGVGLRLAHGRLVE